MRFGIAELTLPPVDYLDDIFARDVMMKQITFTTAVVGNFQAENLEPLYVFKYVNIYTWDLVVCTFLAVDYLDGYISRHWMKTDANM